MYNLERIAKFTESVFDMYGMDKYNFFQAYDEATNQLFNTPLFHANDRDSVAHCLGRVSEMMGLETDVFINTDYNVAKMYWDRYPFFGLYQQVAFLDDCLHQKMRKDAPSIKQRLIHHLRSIDQYIPGTFHEGAEMKNLSFETREFISFPQFQTMAKSLLDMYRRAEQLFFICVREEPTAEEIREFNFLSHWMRLQDIFKPSAIVDYQYILQNKSVYMEEQYNSLTDYTKSRRLLELELWRFKEFSEDRKLAQNLLDILPGAKYYMNRFSMLALNYDCFFRWSDDQAPILEEIELMELRAYEDDSDLDHIPVSQIQSDPVMLYLPKTREELAKYQESSNRLKELCSPPSLGGLNCPSYIWNQYSNEYFLRLLRRMGR